MFELPQAKRPTARKQYPDSISTSLSIIERKHQDNRATRAAAAINGELTMLNLQALLDTNMRMYHPTLPRMIVTKEPFGVLRKRLKEAGAIDIEAFIRQTIRDWASIAAQNRGAHLRNPKKGNAGTPVPPAPTFNSLAYRLPYFLAVFANRLAVAPIKEVQSDESKKIAALEQELARTKKELHSRQLLAPRLQAVVLKPLKLSTTPLLDDDWSPPAWQSRDDQPQQRGKVNAK